MMRVKIISQMIMITIYRLNQKPLTPLLLVKKIRKKT